MGGGGGGGGIVKAVIMGAVLGAATGGIGFGLGFVQGSAVFGLQAGLMSAIAAGAAMGAVGGVLQGVAGAIMGSPKMAEAPALTYEARDRTLSIQQPTAPWRVIYGKARVGGTRTFAESTDNNRKLHVVYTVACHEVTSFEEFWLNEEVVTVNVDGSVQGRWAGKVRVFYGLGTTVGDAGLHSALSTAVGSGLWTADHKQSGRAKVYVEYTYDSDLFAGGVPNASWVIKGKPVYDPRTVVTVWSDNPKLCQRDYLTNYWGWSDEEIDDTELGAAANICDETVSLAAGGTEKRYTCNGSLQLDVEHGENLRRLLTADRGKAIYSGGKWRLLSAAWQVPSITLDEDDLDGGVTVSPRLRRKDLFNGVKGVFANPSKYWQPEDFPTIASDFYKTEDGGRATTFTANAIDDTLVLEDGQSVLTGDPVQLWTTGSLPSPLAEATVYYVIAISAGVAKVATTLANAETGTAVNIADSGTGTHTIRWGERIWKDIELPFTTSGSMCQRIAKIDLLSCRQQVTVTLPCKLTAMRVRAGDVVMVNNTRMGWSAKTFEVNEWAFSVHGGMSEDDPPRLGIDVTLRETDSSVYSWSTSEEQMTDPASDTDLPDPFTVVAPTNLVVQSDASQVVITGTTGAPRMLVSWTESVDAFATEVQVQFKPSAATDWSPAVSAPVGQASVYINNTAVGDSYDIRIRARNSLGVTSDWLSTTHTTDALQPTQAGAPAVVESLYVTRDGAGVKASSQLTWSASTDQLLKEYAVRYRPTTGGDYTYTTNTTATMAEILDVAPGAYDFEVSAVNVVGVKSTWSVTRKEIYGLLAPPSAPQNMTISSISNLAIIRWTQSSDLDVRIGGRVVFRHSPEITGAVWPESTGIGEALPGADTVAVLPLKPGTYLAKAVDSSGVESTTAATVSTNAATLLSFANITQVIESPAFTGTASNAFVSGGALYLAGAGAFDDIPDFDGVSDLDFEGGVATSGSYSFAAGVDLTTTSRVRLTSAIAAAVVNVLDKVDDRSGNIDDWADFDGTSAASADAYVEVQYTTDDPAGSPTWSSWQRLDVAEFNARAFQFRCILTSSDTAYTIAVSSLSVSVDQLA